MKNLSIPVPPHSSVVAKWFTVARLDKSLAQQCAHNFAYKSSYDFSIDTHANNQCDLVRRRKDGPEAIEKLQSMLYRPI